jgi:hypothetical protein
VTAKAGLLRTQAVCNGPLHLFARCVCLLVVSVMHHRRLGAMHPLVCVRCSPIPQPLCFQSAIALPAAILPRLCAVGATTYAVRQCNYLYFRALLTLDGEAKIAP